MRPTILVIDKDDQARTHLGEILEQEGAKVDFANDATSGLDYLKAKSVEILFADLDTLCGNELDGLREARIQQPTLPIIATTANGSVESTIDALRSGATDYLIQPYLDQRVVIALERAIPSWRVEQQQNVLPVRSNGKSPISPMTIRPSNSQSQEWKEKCKSIAPSSLPVLIAGELGVGKERAARLIHSLSPRSHEPFVKVNCEAIQECLLREMFFGKGNLADTSNDEFRGESIQRGFIQNAAGGMLFLHNVTYLPKWMQLELLRAAQAASYHRLDDHKVRPMRARLAASTMRDPQESLESGELLEEFYLYLKSNSLVVPPLRDRREDIRTLLEVEVREASSDPSLKDCCHELHFTEESLRLLETYEWPGNFYELNGFVRRILVFVNEPVVTAETVAKTLPSPVFQCPNTITVPFVGDLKEIQRAIVTEVIKRTRGNKAAAARTLRVHRKTLYRIIEGQPQVSPRPTRISA